MFDRASLLAVGLVGLMVASAGTAAAATNVVEAPEGPYYVHADAEVEDPYLRMGGFDIFCYRGGWFCISVPVPWVDDPGSASADVSVYAEDNGCEGMQTEASDCDGDGETESADEELVHHSAATTDFVDL